MQGAGLWQATSIRVGLDGQQRAERAQSAIRLCTNPDEADLTHLPERGGQRLGV